MYMQMYMFHHITEYFEDEEKKNIPIQPPLSPCASSSAILWAYLYIVIIRENVQLCISFLHI